MTIFTPKKRYDRQTFSDTYSSTIDLKRRMTAYSKKNHPFNWSAYIREAIQAKLEEKKCFKCEKPSVGKWVGKEYCKEHSSEISNTWTSMIYDLNNKEE